MSGEGGLVGFLRERLQEERADIDRIDGGGYAPQRWVLGQGTGEHMAEVWALSRLRQEDRGAAVREDDSPVALVQWGRNEHLHVVRYDPQRMADEVDAKLRLLDEILGYEAMRDGEWGCCHDPADIAAGRCREIPPDEITGLRLLAVPYTQHPDYREEWKP